MNQNSEVKPNLLDPRLFLVTGASGFVGSHLLNHLLSNGVRVRALVRKKEDALKLEALGAEVVVGDLENKKSLEAAVAGVYGIYHIAALYRLAGVPDEVFTRVNLEGTRRILDCAIAAGVKRFIHCSTCGVLGDVGDIPADENTPYSPCDIYQESKVEAEKLVLEYFRNGAIQGVVIRPAMVYGPGDMRMLKLFKMVANGTFFYIGTGEKFVHFVDVRDLAMAFHSGMTRENLTGETYIIAGNKRLTLKQTVEMIAGIFSVSAPRIHLPVKPLQWIGSLCEGICKPFGIEPPIFRRRVDFFTKSRSYSTEKAARDLNFKPTRTFENELRDSIEWYVANGYIKSKKNLNPDVRSIEGKILDSKMGH